MSLFTLVFFSCLCAGLYYLCPLRVRWVLLLLVSYAFYAYNGLSALPFILITTASTFCGALFMSSREKGWDFSCCMLFSGKRPSAPSRRAFCFSMLPTPHP